MAKSVSKIILPGDADQLLDLSRHTTAVEKFSHCFKIRAGLPHFEKLRAILTAFSALPYENLSKIVKFNRHGDDEKARLRLPEEVFEDHLEFRLGGTCFSLTFFLQAILVNQDFPCYPIMADMHAGPDVHCALIVFLEGKKLLVDPGYLLREPMVLDKDRPRLYHTAFTGVELQFNPATECFDLYTFNRTETKWRYRFRDIPATTEQFFRHWQASFHRNGMHGLCLTRSVGEDLIFVHKNFMRISSSEGKRNFNLRQNFHATVQRIFGIAPDYIDRAQAALAANLRLEQELARSCEIISRI